MEHNLSKDRRVPEVDRERGRARAKLCRATVPSSLSHQCPPWAEGPAGALPLVVSWDWRGSPVYGSSCKQECLPQFCLRGQPPSALAAPLSPGPAASGLLSCLSVAPRPDDSQSGLLTTPIRPHCPQFQACSSLGVLGWSFGWKGPVPKWRIADPS